MSDRPSECLHGYTDPWANCLICAIDHASWCESEIERLRARVTELEAERHEMASRLIEYEDIWEVDGVLTCRHSGESLSELGAKAMRDGPGGG